MPRYSIRSLLFIALVAAAVWTCIGVFSRLPFMRRGVNAIDVSERYFEECFNRGRGCAPGEDAAVLARVRRRGAPFEVTGRTGLKELEDGFWRVSPQVCAKDGSLFYVDLRARRKGEWGFEILGTEGPSE